MALSLSCYHYRTRANRSSRYTTSIHLSKPSTYSFYKKNIESDSSASRHDLNSFEKDSIKNDALKLKSKYGGLKLSSQTWSEASKGIQVKKLIDKFNNPDDSMSRKSNFSDPNIKISSFVSARNKFSDERKLPAEPGEVSEPVFSSNPYPTRVNLNNYSTGTTRASSRSSSPDTDTLLEDKGLVIEDLIQLDETFEKQEFQDAANVDTIEEAIVEHPNAVDHDEADMPPVRPELPVFESPSGSYCNIDMFTLADSGHDLIPGLPRRYSSFNDVSALRTLIESGELTNSSSTIPLPYSTQSLVHVHKKTNNLSNSGQVKNLRLLFDRNSGQKPDPSSHALPQTSNHHKSFSKDLSSSGIIPNNGQKSVDSKDYKLPGF